MKLMNLRRTVSLAMLGGAALAIGAPASAAVLYNTGDAGTATIVLGMNSLGHLNATPNVTANATATGIAYKFPGAAGAAGVFRDATAPGCLCEGWGVSVDRTSVAGSEVGRAAVDVFNSGGISNLTGIDFTTDATKMDSQVALTSLRGVTVRHVAQTSTNAPNALFRMEVTITNGTDETLDNVRYVRVMDWDVPLTEFSEFVTIRGTATTTLLERSHNNGFAVPNPLGGDAPISPATLDVDFTDVGPLDHGAFFRFNFGSLEAGESYTFNIFYGAAGTEAAALAAIAAEKIELFSLGQSNGGQVTGSPATFIFGFAGVGGDPVIPTPEPGSLAMLGLGLLGLGFTRRRKA
jgi:type IV pilus assembly protein PilY1